MLYQNVHVYRRGIVKLLTKTFWTTNNDHSVVKHNDYFFQILSPMITDFPFSNQTTALTLTRPIARPRPIAWPCSAPACFKVLLYF